MRFDSLRVLRRAPLFAGVIIATLALAIGATTAIFTVVDSVLLRPLRFADPGRLAAITPSSGSRLSPEYFAEWRRQNQTFTDMAAWHDTRVVLTVNGQPDEVVADRVTTNFFELLGARPLHGRTFTTTSTIETVEPEAVLGHGLWQRRFGADPNVIGRVLTIDGQQVTIVGVMPADFAVRTTELSASLAAMWLPLELQPAVPHGMGGFLHVIGRLGARATFERARADLSLIARRIEDANPSYSRDWTLAVVPLRDATVGRMRTTLLAVFGGAAILLLIACVNVANLVLGRAIARERDVAVRRSLGASTARLVRESIAEHIGIVAIAAALGVLIAFWATQFILPALPAGLDLPRRREIAIDVRVVMFAVAMALSIGVGVGVLPLLLPAQRSLQRLRSAAKVAPGGRRHRRAAAMLILSEMALAVSLVSGAGLLARTFRELTLVDPGFDTGGVLTMRTTLPAGRFASDDRVRAYATDLLERAGNLPGVAAAGTVSYLPMNRFGAAARFQIEGRPDTRLEDQKFAWVSVVGGRYFEAMRIPLVSGRLPGPADTDATPAVFIIDEELANRYWPGQNPIGARLVWPNGTGEPGNTGTLAGEVIGVVGGVRWRGMSSAPNPTAYFWFPQNPEREITIVARTAGNPADMSAAIVSEASEVDPGQPVADIRTLSDVVSADLARPRITMLIVGGFAVVALVLAGLGLYGVTAFAVTQRTREIGVRIAVGASPDGVTRAVMRTALLPVTAGLCVGLAIAVAVSRAAASLLYGVAPGDPVTLGGAIAVLAVVACTAAYLPARRASRLDPAVVLRSE